jgi:hypothetical protein
MKFYSMFPSKNIIDLPLAFDLFRVDFHTQCEVESSVTLLHVNIQLFQHHLLKRRLFPPLKGLDILVEIN